MVFLLQKYCLSSSSTMRPTLPLFLIFILHQTPYHLSSIIFAAYHGLTLIYQSFMKTHPICLIILLLLFPFLAPRKPTIVFVTGYWRSLNQQPFSQQQEQSFIKLLNSTYNFIIFGDTATRDIVTLYRASNKVNFILKEEAELSNAWHAHLFRENIEASHFNKRGEDYLSQVPVMYNKLALMREALIYDQFDAAFLYWIDPFILLKTRQRNYLTMIRQFLMATQPAFVIRTKLSPTAFLRAEERAIAAPYAQGLANKTADCIYFGGRVQTIATYSNIFQNFLHDILKKGWAADDEDTMMLMRNKYPFLFPLVHNISHRQIYQRILIQKEIYLEMAEVRFFELRDQFYLMPNNTYYHYQFNTPMHEAIQQKQPLTFTLPFCSGTIQQEIQARIHELIKVSLFLVAIFSGYVSFMIATFKKVKGQQNDAISIK